MTETTIKAIWIFVAEAIAIIVIALYLFLPAQTRCTINGHSITQVSWFPEMWVCSRCKDVIFTVRRGPGGMGPDTLVIGP